MKKNILITLLIAVIVAGGAFYGGTKYQESKGPSARFSSGQRQQFLPGGAEGTSTRAIGRGAGAGFLFGEVIAKDEQSLTLKMPDGGSKIIFFSEATEISKITEGSVSDIEIGKQVTITGQGNSDGSYTAGVIQLTPRFFMPRD